MIALVDTNVDPDPIDYVIPSNDDAIRAIKLICSKMADASLEGRALRKESMDEEVTDVGGYGYDSFDGMEDVADDQLLGASTLAKLREAEQADTAAVEEAEAVVDTAADEEE